MRSSMSDLSAIPDEALRLEWHRLVQRGRDHGVRADLAAVELELLNRCWFAPCAEEPQP